MKVLYTLLIGLSLVIRGETTELQPEAYGSVVDHAGTITLPQNYRSQWSHIGSWLIADPKAPGHGFHDVYMQPNAVEHYRNTGQFPDGAVIVKEVRKTEEGTKTTGPAHWAGEINIWFVMVKDTKGRFAHSPHWSNGWGWALFEHNASGEESMYKNVSKGFNESCQGCHTPAKDKDWVFVEGYPTLK